MDIQYTAPNEKISIRLHHLLTAKPSDQNYSEFDELFSLLKYHLTTLEHINYLEPITGNSYLMTLCTTIHYDPKGRLEMIRWLLENQIDVNLLNIYTHRTALHYLFETLEILNVDISKLVFDIIIHLQADLNALDINHRIPFTYLLTNPHLPMTPLYLLLVQFLFAANPEIYPLQHDQLTVPLTYYAFANKKRFQIKFPPVSDFISVEASTLPYNLTYLPPSMDILSKQIYDVLDVVGQIDLKFDLRHEWKLYKHLIFAVLPSERQSFYAARHEDSLTHPQWYILHKHSPLLESDPAFCTIIPQPIYELFTILPSIDIGLSYGGNVFNNDHHANNDRDVVTENFNQNNEQNVNKEKQSRIIPVENLITNQILPPLQMLRCLYKQQPDLFNDIHNHIIVLIQAQSYLSPKLINLIKFLVLLQQDAHYELDFANVSVIFQALFTSSFTIPSPRQLKLLSHIFTPSTPTQNSPNDPTPPSKDPYGYITPCEEMWPVDGTAGIRTAPFIDLIDFFFAILENMFYRDLCPKRNPDSRPRSIDNDTMGKLIEFLLFLTANQHSTLYLCQIEKIHKKILLYTPLSNKYNNMAFLLKQFEDNIEYDREVKKREEEDRVEKERIEQNEEKNCIEKETEGKNNNNDSSSSDDDSSSSGSDDDSGLDLSADDSDSSNTSDSNSNSDCSSDSDSSSDTDSTSSSDSDSSTGSDTDNAYLDIGPVAKFRRLARREKYRQFEIDFAKKNAQNVWEKNEQNNWQNNFVSVRHDLTIPPPIAYVANSLHNWLLESDLVTILPAHIVDISSTQTTPSQLTPLTPLTPPGAYESLNWDLFFSNPSHTLLTAIYKPLDGSKSCPINSHSSKYLTKNCYIPPKRHPDSYPGLEKDFKYQERLKRIEGEYRSDVRDIRANGYCCRKCSFKNYGMNAADDNVSMMSEEEIDATRESARVDAVWRSSLDFNSHYHFDIYKKINIFGAELDFEFGRICHEGKYPIVKENNQHSSQNNEISNQTISNENGENFEQIPQNPQNPQNPHHFSLFHQIQQSYSNLNIYHVSDHHPGTYYPNDEFITIYRTQPQRNLLHFIRSLNSHFMTTFGQDDHDSIIPTDFKSSMSSLHHCVELPVLTHGFTTRLIDICGVTKEDILKRYELNRQYLQTVDSQQDGSDISVPLISYAKDIIYSQKGLQAWLFTNIFDVPFQFSFGNTSSLIKGLKKFRNSGQYYDPTNIVNLLFFSKFSNNLNFLINFMNIYAEIYEQVQIANLAQYIQSHRYNHIKTIINSHFYSLILEFNDHTPTANFREIESKLGNFLDQIASTFAIPQYFKNSHKFFKEFLNQTSLPIPTLPTFDPPVVNFYQIFEQIQTINTWYSRPLFAPLKYLIDFTPVFSLSAQYSSFYSHRTDRNGFLCGLLSYGHFKGLTDKDQDELWYYLRDFLHISPIQGTKLLKVHEYSHPNVRAVMKKYGKIITKLDFYMTDSFPSLIRSTTQEVFDNIRLDLATHGIDNDDNKAFEHLKLMWNFTVQKRQETEQIFAENFDNFAGELGCDGEGDFFREFFNNFKTEQCSELGYLWLLTLSPDVRDRIMSCTSKEYQENELFFKLFFPQKSEKSEQNGNNLNSDESDKGTECIHNDDIVEGEGISTSTLNDSITLLPWLGPTSAKDCGDEENEENEENDTKILLEKQFFGFFHAHETDASVFTDERCDSLLDWTTNINHRLQEIDLSINPLGRPYSSTMCQNMFKMMDFKARFDAIQHIRQKALQKDTQKDTQNTAKSPSSLTPRQVKHYLADTSSWFYSQYQFDNHTPQNHTLSQHSNRFLSILHTLKEITHGTPEYEDNSNTDLRHGDIPDDDRPQFHGSISRFTFRFIFDLFGSYFNLPKSLMLNDIEFPLHDPIDTNATPSVTIPSIDVGNQDDIETYNLPPDATSYEQDNLTTLSRHLRHSLYHEVGSVWYDPPFPISSNCKRNLFWMKKTEPISLYNPNTFSFQDDHNDDMYPMIDNNIPDDIENELQFDFEKLQMKPNSRKKIEDILNRKRWVLPSFEDSRLPYEVYLTLKTPQEYAEMYNTTGLWSSLNEITDLNLEKNQILLNNLDQKMNLESQKRLNNSQKYKYPYYESFSAYHEALRLSGVNTIPINLFDNLPHAWPQGLSSEPEKRLLDPPLPPASLFNITSLPYRSAYTITRGTGENRFREFALAEGFPEDQDRDEKNDYLDLVENILECDRHMEEIKNNCQSNIEQNDQKMDDKNHPENNPSKIITPFTSLRKSPHKVYYTPTDIYNSTPVERFEAYVEKTYLDYAAIFSEKSLLIHVQSLMCDVLRGVMNSYSPGLTLTHSAEALGKDFGCKCGLVRDGDGETIGKNVFERCAVCIEMEEEIFGDIFSVNKKVNAFFPILTFNIMMRYLVPIYSRQTNNFIPLLTTIIYDQSDDYAMTQINLKPMKPNFEDKKSQIVEKDQIFGENFPENDSQTQTPRFFNTILSEDDQTEEERNSVIDEINDLMSYASRYTTIPYLEELLKPCELPPHFFLLPFQDVNFDFSPLKNNSANHSANHSANSDENDRIKSTELNPFETAVAYALGTFRSHDTLELSIENRSAHSHIYTSETVSDNGEKNGGKNNPQKKTKTTKNTPIILKDSLLIRDYSYELLTLLKSILSTISERSITPITSIKRPNPLTSSNPYRIYSTDKITENWCIPDFFKPSLNVLAKDIPEAALMKYPISGIGEKMLKLIKQFFLFFVFEDRIAATQQILTKFAGFRYNNGTRTPVISPLFVWEELSQLNFGVQNLTQFEDNNYQKNNIKNTQNLTIFQLAKIFCPTFSQNFIQNTPEARNTKLQVKPAFGDIEYIDNIEFLDMFKPNSHDLHLPTGYNDYLLLAYQFGLSSSHFPVRYRTNNMLENDAGYIYHQTYWALVDSHLEKVFGTWKELELYKWRNKVGIERGGIFMKSDGKSDEICEQKNNDQNNTQSLTDENTTLYSISDLLATFQSRFFTTNYITLDQKSFKKNKFLTQMSTILELLFKTFSLPLNPTVDLSDFVILLSSFQRLKKPKFRTRPFIFCQAFSSFYQTLLLKFIIPALSFSPPSRWDSYDRVKIENNNSAQNNQKNDQNPSKKSQNLTIFATIPQRFAQFTSSLEDIVSYKLHSLDFADTNDIPGSLDPSTLTPPHPSSPSQTPLLSHTHVSQSPYSNPDPTGSDGLIYGVYNKAQKAYGYKNPPKYLNDTLKNIYHDWYDSDNSDDDASDGSHHHYVSKGTKPRLLQRFINGHLSHSALIEPSLHKEVQVDHGESRTSTGLVGYDHHIFNFVTILKIFRKLLVSYLGVVAQNPAQIEFINWLSLYVATNITPYSYIFPGQDELYTLTHTPHLQDYNWPEIETKKFTKSTIPTYYKTLLFSTLIYKLQYKVTPDGHSIAQSSYLFDPNTDFLGLLVTSYQKSNKYWSQQLQTLLSAGGGFLIPTYSRAMSRGLGRKAIYAAFANVAGNESVLSSLPLAPSLAKEPNEVRFWGMIDKYYSFHLPANNRFISPIDALCSHPVLEISGFFQKLRVVAENIEKNDKKKSIYGIINGDDNGIKILSLTQILETLDGVVKMYYEKLELFNQEFDKKYLQEYSNWKLNQKNEKIEKIGKENFIQKITTTLSNDILIMSTLSFINEWRHYIEQVLPILDLYPNFGNKFYQTSTCNCGTEDFIHFPIHFETFYEKLSKKIIPHTKENKNSKKISKKYSWDSEPLSHPVISSCLQCTYRLSMHIARSLNSQLLNDGLHPAYNKDDSILDGDNDTDSNQNDEHPEPSTQLITSNPFPSESTLSNSHFITNALLTGCYSDPSRKKTYRYATLGNMLPYHDVHRLKNISAAHMRWVIDVLHPSDMSTNYVNLVTETFPPIYPYRPVGTKVNIEVVEHDGNVSSTVGNENLPKQCTDSDASTNLVIPFSGPQNDVICANNDQCIDGSDQVVDTQQEHFHYPYQVSFHLASTSNLHFPEGKVTHSHITGPEKDMPLQVPYWIRHEPSFTNGIFWYLFSNSVLSLDDVVSLLSCRHLTLYNTGVSVNQYKQTLLTLVLLQNHRNNIFYSKNDQNFAEKISNPRPKNIHHNSEALLTTIWSTLTSPHINYTIDYSNDDIIYSVLFHKDLFGWILFDYIKFLNVPSYAPQWCHTILGQYQLYDPTIQF